MCRNSLKKTLAILSIILGIGAIKIPGILDEKFGILQVIPWTISFIYTLFLYKVISKGFYDSLRDKNRFDIFFLSYSLGYTVIISALSIAMAKSINIVFNLNQEVLAIIIIFISYFVSKMNIKRFQYSMGIFKVIFLLLIPLLLIYSFKGIKIKNFKFLDIVMASSMSFWSFVGFELIKDNNIKSGYLAIVIAFTVYLLISIVFSASAHMNFGSESLEYTLFKGNLGIPLFIAVQLMYFSSIIGVIKFINNIFENTKLKSVYLSIAIILSLFSSFRFLIEISVAIIISSIVLISLKNMKDWEIFTIVILSQIINPYFSFTFPVLFLIDVLRKMQIEGSTIDTY